MDPRFTAWLGFPGHGEHHGWDARQRMKMAAARGGWGSHGGGGGGGGSFGFPFPPGFPFHGGDPRGGPHRFGGGPKVRRGDVRAAVLALLSEEPRNGYQLIQEVAERSGGIWRPSAGSVYPVLQQLEDEGLARTVPSGSRRLYELTEEGRRYVEEHPDECGAPWEEVRDSVGQDAMEIQHLLRQVFMAGMQVLQAGSAAQTAEMHRVLSETRRSLYRILAEEDGGDTATHSS